MFQNKVVVVTGAANGIGKAIAEGYAREGAKVVFADIDSESGLQLEKEWQREGLDVLFVKADVAKEADVINLMAKASSVYGRIHILINNAGKSMQINPFEMTAEQFDDMIGSNLRSVFLCSREAAKYMKNDFGSIVNIASTRAIQSEPHWEAYAASKGGIVALTHAMANSFQKEEITVNSISPGWIETGDYEQLTQADHYQHLSNRVGKPADILRACLFLTDPRNDFVNGENIVVDGGMTRKMIYE